MFEMEGAADNAAGKTVLDYGRRRRWLTRRKVLSILIVGLLAFVSVIYGPRVTRSFLHRVATWRQGRELATMTLSTTQPVLSGALSLSTYDLESRRLDPGTFHQPRTPYDIWFAYARAPQHRGYVLFHELLTPSGQPRLLALHCAMYDFDNSYNFDGVQISVNGLLWIRAPLGQYPQGYWQTSGNDIDLIRGTRGNPTRITHSGSIYAAVINPTDRNRFTLRFTLDDKEGKLEGRLLEDGKIRMLLIEGDFPDANNAALEELAPQRR